MTVKASSERLADAMERLRVKAEAAAAAAVTANRAALLATLTVVEYGHKLVLKKVQALEKAWRCLGETGEGKPEQGIAIFQSFNDFLCSRLASQLQEEERTLFPLHEHNSPEGSALVTRMRLDHAAILEKRQNFANSLEIAAELADNVLPRAVWVDLVAFGLELCDLLAAHALCEMQAIRQCLLAIRPSDFSGESNAAADSEHRI